MIYTSFRKCLQDTIDARFLRNRRNKYPTYPM